MIGIDSSFLGCLLTYMTLKEASVHLITDEDFMLVLGLFQENMECFTVVDLTTCN